MSYQKIAIFDNFFLIEYIEKMRHWTKYLDEYLIKLVDIYGKNG
jgi:hypothetical protein